MVHKIYHFNVERSLENLSLSSIHKLPGHVAQYLKNHQIDGIRFIYQHFELNQSCILNDDHGLGKTMQVMAFLSAIFSNSTIDSIDKKCLIIVKNEERLTNWRFHLDVFTKLQVKVIFKKDDACNENIYITKWNSLSKSVTLHHLSYDYIIIDDRDDLLSNKFCLNYLLKHYRNKISLILASDDVTMDLKLFHNILKLCGLLSKEYEDSKYFEKKFSLPNPVSKNEKDILEAYFIRREKINNFCRDFRLRRYRHQFEDILPLAAMDEYEKSLELWKEKGIRISSCSTNNSDSIKIISSSEDKNTDELFESLLNVKEDKKLNKEVKKILENKSNNDNDDDEKIEDDEEVVMSPLLFISDSEDNAIENVSKNKEKIDKDNNQHLKENLKSRKDDIDSKNSSKSSSTTQKSKKKQSNSSKHGHVLRSYVRVTRSRTQKNKYLVSDISENIKLLDKVGSKKLKQSNKKYHTSKINKNDGEKSKKSSTVEAPELQLKINSPKNSLSLDSKYNFNIDFSNDLTLKDKNENESTDVHFLTPDLPNDELIVLSDSSIDDGETKSNIEKKRNISPSPDLFSISGSTTITTNNDDYNIPCAQKNQSKSIEQRNSTAKFFNSSKSCMVMLARPYHYDENEKKAKIKNSLNGNKDEVKKTNKTNIKVNLQNDEDNNILEPFQTIRNNKNDAGNRNNKITKYFIGNSSNNDSVLAIDSDSSLSSFADDFLQSTAKTKYNGKVQNRRYSEINHRTPKRQRIQSKSIGTGKKSPRMMSSINTTPNSLTKWLLKSPSSALSKLADEEETEIPPKRIMKRRLDISFQNL